MPSSEIAPDDGTGMTLEEWLATILKGQPPETVNTYQVPTRRVEAEEVETVQRALAAMDHETERLFATG